MKSRLGQAIAGPDEEAAIGFEAGRDRTQKIRDPWRHRHEDFPSADRGLTLAAARCSLASIFAAAGYVPAGNPVKILRRVAARTIKNVERSGD